MMRVEPGRVAAVRFSVEGMVGGRPAIVMEHVNRLTAAAAPEWPIPPEGRPGVHRVVVSGRPGVEINTHLGLGETDHNVAGVMATAAKAVNAIEVVCDAAPGPRLAARPAGGPGPPPAPMTEARPTPPQPSIQGRVPPTRPEEGRAQERGDRTRTAIIEETIRCVLDEGFASASAKHIAERAGVTWGVIQYHFGDRSGLLGAVVASGYESFRQSIEALDIPEGTTKERVAAIVDAAWSAFSRPVSRASLEITVATRTTRAQTQNTELAAMARTMHQLGERIVGDQPGQRALGRLIGDVLWATLRGLVLAEMVTGEHLAFSRERALLCDLIVAYLDPDPQA